MTRIKCCGIATPAELRAAVAAGADAVGVVADVPVETHRAVDPATAARLFAAAPPFVTTVLVTMVDPGRAETPATAGRLLERLERTGADAIQVHGRPDPSTIRTLVARTPPAVDVLVGVDPQPIAARSYATGPDALVVDAPTASGRGGTGRRVDVERARAVLEAAEVPVVLAGGLGPGNVAEAVARVGPHAVDAATGLEDEDGRLDPERAARFVAAAREGEPTAHGIESAERTKSGTGREGETGQSAERGEVSGT